MILTNRPNPRLGVAARVLVLAAAVGLLPWGVTLADDPPKPVTPPPGVEAPGGENRATVTLRLTAQQADYEAEVKSAEVALAVARDNLTHTEQLVKKGFATAKQAQVAKLELEAAAARLEAAKVRQQAGRAEPGRGGARVSFTAPAEEVERLKEEVELLAVQLDIKRAHLVAAQASATGLRRMLESINKSAAAERFEKESAVQAAEAQVMIRQAELREHELRLTHAKRRLERLTSLRPILPPPVAPKRASNRLPAPLPDPPSALTPAAEPGPTDLNRFRDQLVASQRRVEELVQRVLDLTIEVRQMRKERDRLTAMVERLEKQLPEKK